MTTITEGSLLWQPSPEQIANANLTRYMNWLRAERGLDFADYLGLWQWSVDDIDGFWASIWDYFGVVASAPYTGVLGKRTMPGAEWFPGARLNYAENLLSKAADTRPAILYQAEGGALSEISWAELTDMAAKVAHTLRGLGVEAGDRIVGYLPHIPETIAAFLGTASLGAIWSSCPPDFGSQSVLDRFTQIEPKVLIACNGYGWAGKPYDRRDVVAELRAKLPSLVKTILIPYPGLDHTPTPDDGLLLWPEMLETAPPNPMDFAQVPFDHPLWVLYSSGTTGKPKPIVQSHGGILLEHLKTINLQLDLTPADRFFWYTSTGWMMWNFLVGGLLNGTPIIVYNGSPAYPNMNALWRLAEANGMTYFGTGAAFILACMKADIHPGRDYDLSRLRALGSTGSPLPVTGFQWVYDEVSPNLALESISGGTDVCTAFIGGARTQPIYAGELQGPGLGCKVQSFDDDGTPLIDEVGELVITEPMPSMPIYFWNDPGMARYKESYFEMYPGVWRHGDWIKINARNGCVIYGRSDSTINRQGIRMGTSEIYQAVESFDEVTDSLIIDLELLGRESYMPLFVTLREGVTLDDDLVARIKAKIRADISPRHAPDDIFVIDQAPYTLSGKKMEVPIRKILLGHDPQKAANAGAMRNPEALDYFIDFARKMAEKDKPRELAAVFVAPRQVEIWAVEDRALATDEVRLQTLYSGISAGTELTAYRGSNPYLHKRWDAEQRLFVPDADSSLAYPIIAYGYEECGKVVEIGSDVTRVALGDLIYGTWGHRTRHIVTEAYAAERILPPELDPMLGIFSHIGAIGLNGILDAGIRVGETVAVFGLGTPGQIIAQLAKRSGASVIGIEPLALRRNLALESGALDYALSPADDDVAEAIRVLTDGRGADVCIEASGAYPALHEAIRSVAYSAKVVTLGFFQGAGSGLYLGEEFHHNRVSVICSQISGVSPELSHRWDRARLVRTFMEMQATGAVTMQPLITHVFPFSDAAEAFRLCDEEPDKTLQTVLAFDT
ncbi:MAG: acetoacetate--CoA ligase [Caldilineaceae bacterium]|nr:acetoacetate--CoA ligase [Caldilineaceae bacterium]